MSWWNNDPTSSFSTDKCLDFRCIHMLGCKGLRFETLDQNVLFSVFPGFLYHVCLSVFFYFATMARINMMCSHCILSWVLFYVLAGNSQTDSAVSWSRRWPHSFRCVWKFSCGWHFIGLCQGLGFVKKVWISNKTGTTFCQHIKTQFLLLWLICKVTCMVVSSSKWPAHLSYMYHIGFFCKNHSS